MNFYVPPAAQIIPRQAFESVIASVGQRISWLKGHACPCTYAGGGANGYLPQPGGAQKNCKTCLGLGVYWDPPSLPFRAWMKFVEMSPTPDEPGVRVDQNYGIVQLAEPSMTLPYTNPNLPVDDPGQPTAAWNDASTDDQFVPVDMLARFTAKLQVGGVTYIPYQQNLQIAPAGAVTVWNTETMAIEPVESYGVDGASVTIDGYPDQTAYMVEFQAAPTYVVFRPAGGIPHVRPFGGGTVNEPRRFKLQLLDFWTRQRGQGPSVAGSTNIAGTAFPQVIMTGSLQNGG
jgi:hypothetical protein